MPDRRVSTYSDANSVSSTLAAFDLASIDYDETFDSLPGTRRLRQIFISLLSDTFEAGSSLLELNCGTGTDAITLGHKGYRVLATDVSSAMIAATQTKIQQERLDDRIKAMELSFLDLKKLSGHMVDGAYSDFGGLNCTSDISLVAEQLATVIRSGGYFVASVMSDFCVWETTSFLLRGHFRKAFRRSQSEGAIANVHGEAIRVNYFSPSEVSKAFSHYFVPRGIIGLNILTPPPTSLRLYKSFPRILQKLESLDDMISKMSLFRRIGDHFCIILQRKTGDIDS